MALRGLVEGDCGGQNPLTKLRGHFTQDRGRLQEGLRRSNLDKLGGFLQQDVEGLSDQGLVTEFLHETRQVTALRPPTTFRMGSLLQELKSIGLFYQEYGGWAEDYLSSIPVVEPKDNLMLNQGIDAAEYEQFVASLDSSRISEERSPGSGAEEWAQEFLNTAQTDLQTNIQSNTEAYRQDFWKNLEDEWREMAGDDNHPWIQDYSAAYEPFSEYQFQEENSAAENSNINHLEEGKQKLKEGDLPSAVLLFEAAVRQDADNREAWLLLGQAQAQNEQDPQAISALRKCLSLDPTERTALMSLAVSLTNESYQAQACQALTMWLQNHEDYGHLVVNPIDKISFNSSFMSQDLHQQTTDWYVQEIKEGSNLDPNIQAGLGILFNLSGDYDKAVDCFKAALISNPDDSLLWNRLGATLANGNRSEEAVSAYHTALRYSPGYIRCRYNLGISCINLKAYKEAAEHFLTALNFQATGRGPGGSESTMSETIWSSLRLAVSFINRPDLKELTDKKDLAALSAEFNISSLE
ncbi:peroxisomal targeting signal 1 receptor [Eurytemora carolleeae]|uniref:peroxisomal targeting signal 1 receptor n=1 Tax=Eurytemora carolleeae TaxID=1294199 RepID=UPI000C759D24|nr:peroxisomal targeting signal 1 receptor [Eurytemora carolleeae]|eukprot:XP_023344476.1 peroxisomal targeting signal 1 receptor-like [Eurytemora affinis]